MLHILSSPDYLFLVQGVAWILALAPALTLRRLGHHPAWRFFAMGCGAFAAQALAEMLLTDMGDTLAFAVARYLVLSAALAAMCEFSRRVLTPSAFGRGNEVVPIAIAATIVALGLFNFSWADALRRIGSSLVLLGASASVARLSLTAPSQTRARLCCCSLGLLVLATASSLATLPSDSPFRYAPVFAYDQSQTVWHLIRIGGVLTVSGALVLEFNQRHLRTVFREAGNRPSRRELTWGGVLLAVIASGLFGTHWLQNYTDREMRQAVTDRMRMAAAAIELSRVATLKGAEEDLQNSDYQSLKRLLSVYARANPDVRFAMLMSVRGDEVRFLADSEPSESADYSPPGQSYDEAPLGYATAVARGKPFVLGPITDRWGSWISGSHPLDYFGPELGWVTLDLDFSATVWNRRVLMSRIPGLSIVLLVTTLLLISYRAQWRVRESAVELAAVENRSASLVEGSPNCVLMLDLQGRAVSVNGNGLKSLRLQRDQVIGRTFVELWPVECRESLQASVQRTFQGQVTTSEATYLVSGDTNLTFRVTLSPISEGTQEIRHLVCICVDITERKRYEQQLCAAKEDAEAAARAKSDFLAVMSHEIRTPLGGVIGMLSLLRKLPQNPQQQHYTQLAHDSAEILLELLNDILDAAKVEAGRLSLEHIPFDVRLELDRIVQCMRFKAVEKGLDLECRFSEQIPQYLEGDPTRLRQVLANLLSNALKFTARGKISVEIDVAHRVGEQLVLRGVVSDTGIGMSRETQERLFGRFVQGDASTTRRYGGTGLGLSIAKHIVELMGGHIEVESEVGRGTRFFFTVNLTVAKDCAAQAPSANLDDLPIHHSELRVLCADDEMINRVIIENLVTEMGHKITFAENGESALQQLSSGDFDVVLMDNRMPVMDGLHATRAIRDPRSPVRDHEIYIVASTASASAQNQQECLDVGMNDYVAKPIREAELHAAFSRAILANVKRGKFLPQNQRTTGGNSDIPGLSEEALLASVEASIIENMQNGRELPLRPELVAQYLIDAPKRIEQLRSTYAQRDFDALGIAAHSLKNISQYVNAYMLSRLAADLEADADAVRTDGIDDLIARIAAEFARVRSCLENHIVQNSTP